MKGPAAGVGIILLALGALLIWAGFQGVSLLSVIQGVLSGQGLTSSSGGKGGSGGKLARGDERKATDAATPKKDPVPTLSGSLRNDPVPTLADSLNTNTITQAGGTR